MRTSKLLSSIFLSLIASAALVGCDGAPAPTDGEGIHMERGIGLRADTPAASAHTIRTGTYRSLEGAEPALFASLELLEGQAFRRQARCEGDGCSASVIEGYYEESDTVDEAGVRRHELSFYEGKNGALIDVYKAQSYETVSFGSSEVPRPSLRGYVLMLERLGENGGARTSLALVDGR